MHCSQPLFLPHALLPSCCSPFPPASIRYSSVLPHCCCCCCSDYVFQQRKFGGNAQAITGKRWLHHTSFLWDYRPEAMALLQHPPKAPEYREVSGGR